MPYLTNRHCWPDQGHAAAVLLAKRLKYKLPGTALSDGAIAFRTKLNPRLIQLITNLVLTRLQYSDSRPQKVKAELFSIGEKNSEGLEFLVPNPQLTTAADNLVPVLAARFD